MTSSRLLICVSQPATEPVTLAEAKLFLRVDAATDDALITDLITAARAKAEEYIAHSLITQSWKIVMNDAVLDGLPLPRGPVQSITSIISYDKTNVATTISASVYRLNAALDALRLDGTVFGDRVEVTYVTGYGAAANVPKPIKQGILTHIAMLYEHRDAGDVLPLASQGLYNTYREVRV